MYDTCGKIVTTFDNKLKKRMFKLNCEFCSACYKCLLEFINHMDKHIDLLISSTKSLEPQKCHEIDYEPENIKIDLKTDDFIQDPLENLNLKVESLTSFTDLETQGNRQVTPNILKTEINNGSESDISDVPNTDNEIVMTDIATEKDIYGTREFILALISGYKESQLLWNSSHSHFKLPKRRLNSLAKLTNSLTIQFNIIFKVEKIEKLLKNICKQYSNDLQKAKTAELNGENFEPCWYFPKLNFLKKFIEPTELKVTLIENLTTFQGRLSDEQQLELINIYKSFPCLWNTQHIGYRLKNERKKATEELLNTIKQKMKLEIKESHLNKRLYRIRFLCTKEKMRQLKCERNKTKFKPTEIYSKISFLYDHVNPFKCPKCALTFKAYDKLQIHISTHDPIDFRLPFKCLICQKGFTTAGNRSVHVRRHNQNYTIQCKICEKKFASTGELGSHMRHQHTGERPYFCDICGKRFCTAGELRKHKRRHDQEFSHVCKICNKGFYEKNCLNEHMQIHQNVRDKICNICGKGFTTLRYLRVHKETHAKEKKYVCKICGKDFAQYAGLFIHMKMH